MKAIVKFTDGAKDYSMREVAKPIPAKDELVLEVKRVGICGTDIHIIRDEYPHSLPVTLGHEYVAKVAEIGGETEGYVVGDTVVSLACAYTCQKCTYCESGLDMCVLSGVPLVLGVTVQCANILLFLHEAVSR